MSITVSKTATTPSRPYGDFCPTLHIPGVELYLDEENTGPGLGVVRFAAEPPVGTSVSEDDDSPLTGGPRQRP